MFRPFLAGAMLALLVLPIGCNIPRFQAKKDIEQIIDLEDAKQLIVGSQNGGIKVTLGEAGKVRMLAHITANGSTQEEADNFVAELAPVIQNSGSDLSINHPKTMGMFSSISYELEVPSDLSLALKTSNGAIHVQDIASPIRCETSNGSIHVQGALNSLVAKTSNGRIELKDCIATIDAKSSNGRIEMARCQLLGDSQLRTSNGSIDVALTREQPIELNAETSNGSIKSELQLDKESRKRTRLSGLAFASNDKNPVKLELDTSNGSITIKESETTMSPTPTVTPPSSSGKGEIEL